MERPPLFLHSSTKVNYLAASAVITTVIATAVIIVVGVGEQDDDDDDNQPIVAAAKKIITHVRSSFLAFTVSYEKTGKEVTVFD
ncbi:MAG: hypothetical protein LBS36_02515 [Oscillospiraceae bacterium]|jgi:hypothetical protein|nr:hypothetical protein [Oscillospiraceae bacterium]